MMIYSRTVVRNEEGNEVVTASWKLRANDPAKFWRKLCNQYGVTTSSKFVQIPNSSSQYFRK